MLSSSFFICFSIQHDAFSEVRTNASIDHKHLCLIFLHETCCFKFTPHRVDYHSKSRLINPFSQHISLLYLLDLLLEHVGFDYLEDIPLMKLEISILLIEFVFFSFVNIGHRLKDFSTMELCFKI